MEELIIVKILYKNLASRAPDKEAKIYPLDFVMKNLDYFKEIYKDSFDLNRMLYQESESREPSQGTKKIKKGARPADLREQYKAARLLNIQQENESLYRQQQSLQEQNRHFFQEVSSALEEKLRLEITCHELRAQLQQATQRNSQL